MIANRSHSFIYFRLIVSSWSPGHYHQHPDHHPATKMMSFDPNQFLIVRLINTPRNKYLVYMFLHVPKHWLSICYQIFMWMLIMSCILVTMFMSIDVGSVTEYVVLFWLDLTCLIIFTCEFVLNVWASTVLPKYSGPYGIYWMLINPLYMIDMAVIGLTIADVALDCLWMPLAAGLRGFRMIHFFQYRFVMIRLLWKAIWSERFQLMVSLYYCIVWVFSFGFLMYFIEQPFNSYFNTVANSVWWAVVTFTTVGYGNAAPITTAGKIVTAFAMIAGVWLFGLPAGIVGAALAMKCEEETSTAGTLRQNFGAAMVQAAWKVYRIRKEQDRQQEDDPPLLVRLSPYDHSLQFVRQSTPSPTPTTRLAPDGREYFHPEVVKFIFLLKYYNYRRKFIQTEEINDSKNFYATYMQTSWQQTNLLLNLQNRLDHLWDTVNEAKQHLNQFVGRPRPSSSTARRRSAALDNGGPGDDHDDDDDHGPDHGPDDQRQQPQQPQRRRQSSSTRSNQTSTIDSGTTVESTVAEEDEATGGGFKKDSPLIMLQRHRIPLSRLLRRQIQCWKCLYRRELARKRKLKRRGHYDVPQPLVDLGTPPTTPTHQSQQDLLL